MKPVSLDYRQGRKDTCFLLSCIIDDIFTNSSSVEESKHILKDELKKLSKEEVFLIDLTKPKTQADELDRIVSNG